MIKLAHPRSGPGPRRVHPRRAPDRHRRTRAGKSEVVGARCRRLLGPTSTPRSPSSSPSRTSRSRRAARRRATSSTRVGRRLRHDRLAHRSGPSVQLEESEAASRLRRLDQARHPTPGGGGQTPASTDVRHVVVDEVQDVVGVRARVRPRSPGPRAQGRRRLHPPRRSDAEPLRLPARGRRSSWPPSTYLDAVHRRFAVEDLLSGRVPGSRSPDARAVALTRADLACPTRSETPRGCGPRRRPAPLGQLDRGCADNIRASAAPPPCSPTPRPRRARRVTLSGFGAPVGSLRAHGPSLAPWIASLLVLSTSAIIVRAGPRAGGQSGLADATARRAPWSGSRPRVIGWSSPTYPSAFGVVGIHRPAAGPRPRGRRLHRPSREGSRVRQRGHGRPG